MDLAQFCPFASLASQSQHHGIDSVSSLERVSRLRHALAGDVHMTQCDVVWFEGAEITCDLG